MLSTLNFTLTNVTYTKPNPIKYVTYSKFYLDKFNLHEMLPNPIKDMLSIQNFTLTNVTYT